MAIVVIDTVTVSAASVEKRKLVRESISPKIKFLPYSMKNISPQRKAILLIVTENEVYRTPLRGHLRSSYCTSFVRAG